MRKKAHGISVMVMENVMKFNFVSGEKLPLVSREHFFFFFQIFFFLIHTKLNVQNNIANDINKNYPNFEDALFFCFCSICFSLPSRSTPVPPFYQNKYCKKLQNK